MELEDQMDQLPASSRRLSAAASELDPAAASMLRFQRSMMTETAPDQPLEPLADDEATGKPENRPLEIRPETEMAQQLRELRQMLEVQRQQMEVLQQELRKRDAQIRSTEKKMIPGEDDDPVSSVARSVQGFDFQEIPENGQKIRDRAPQDRSGREEARAQLAGWPDGELKPFLNERLCQFEQFQIEGFIFDARECANGRQRRIDFKAASEAKDIAKFRTRDAERLELFLESVVRTINHWDVQPGDWGRVLTYYLDTAVVRALRLEQPTPTTFAQVVHYLRTTYPVGGAIESARIVEFRNTVQGDQTVTDFYEALCKFQETAPREFTERELTRQFVNSLQPTLRAEVRKEYDRNIQGARLLTLYQMALGVEMRGRQDRQPAAVSGVKHGSGSWYGKPREKAIAAAAVSSSPPATAWTPGTCYNCGVSGHQLRQCKSKCDNCKQAGHVFKTCQKPCPKCGQTNHSHRFCRPDRAGALQQHRGPSGPPDSERREVQILACLPRTAAYHVPACVILVSHATALGTSTTHLRMASRLRRRNTRSVLLTRMHLGPMHTPLQVGLDTLAAANVMTRITAERLGVLQTMTASHLHLDGVGTSPSLGMIQVALRVFADSSPEPTVFEVIDSLPAPIELLVGLPWLEDHHADLRLRRTGRTRVTLVPLGHPSDDEDDDDSSVVYDPDDL